MIFVPSFGAVEIARHIDGWSFGPIPDIVTERTLSRAAKLLNTIRLALEVESASTVAVELTLQSLFGGCSESAIARAQDVIMMPIPAYVIRPRFGQRGA